MFSLTQLGSLHEGYKPDTAPQTSHNPLLHTQRAVVSAGVQRLDQVFCLVCREQKASFTESLRAGPSLITRQSQDSEQKQQWVSDFQESHLK